MLRFTHMPHAMPRKRSSAQRRQDFQEIYDEFAPEKGREQASRCSQCGVPYCQIHCPLHNNIPDWLMLASEGRLHEAYALSSATNAMPEICGRICPQDRLCEGNCVIEQAGHNTVTIGAVERFITETAWEQDWIQPITPTSTRPHTVGIIGAGPAGLAAATVLCGHGYDVTIYDRHDRAGGLLMYGIPNFKLDKKVVQRRTSWLEASGVRVLTDTAVGHNTTFQDLRDRHHALLIATGVYQPRTMPDTPTPDQGVIQALDYLNASTRALLQGTHGAPCPDIHNAQGKNVLVIGGGDTAMDCVRTAIRQGARSVQCLYRRDRANMPGSAREVEHAEEEGVRFQWLCQPTSFEGTPHVTAVHSHAITLGPPDPSGRRTPIPNPDASSRFDANMVVLALGFEAEDLPYLFQCPELPVTRWGTIKTTDTLGSTALPGVFAAGDIVRGASLVVWAVHDGQNAARAIHAYLEAL